MGLFRRRMEAGLGLEGAGRGGDDAADGDVVGGEVGGEAGESGAEELDLGSEVEGRGGRDEEGVDVGGVGSMGASYLRLYRTNVRSQVPLTALGCATKK